MRQARAPSPLGSTMRASAASSRSRAACTFTSDTFALPRLAREVGRGRVDARCCGPADRFMLHASAAGSCRAEPAFVFDEARDRVDAASGSEVGEHERAGAAHAFGIALHDFERGADVRRKIDLVDDQEIRAGDAGAALGGNLVAGGDVDDVYGE